MPRASGFQQAGTSGTRQKDHSRFIISLTPSPTNEHQCPSGHINEPTYLALSHYHKIYEQEGSVEAKIAKGFRNGDLENVVVTGDLKYM